MPVSDAPPYTNSYRQSKHALSRSRTSGKVSAMISNAASFSATSATAAQKRCRVPCTPAYSTAGSSLEAFFFGFFAIASAPGSAPSVVPPAASMMDAKAPVAASSVATWTSALFPDASSFPSFAPVCMSPSSSSSVPGSLSGAGAARVTVALASARSTSLLAAPLLTPSSDRGSNADVPSDPSLNSGMDARYASTGSPPIGAAF
mmetsp:Transcript_9669/g.44021  ORF Transcript_9669/g.44021 Transcript_9669/m.44021 type:complete len:204 (-) Transcript_9669:2626-3237(-)